MKNLLILLLLIPIISFGQKKAERLLDNGDKKMIYGDFRGAIDDYYEAILVVLKKGGKSDYAIYMKTHIYGQLGSALYETGNYKSSIANYTKAIELDPNFSDAYYNRGISKDDLEDYYGAISDYTKTIELDPNDAGAYVNRGVSKRKLKNYHGAIADQTKAIELDPNFADAYTNRGVAKYDAGLNGCPDLMKAKELGGYVHPEAMKTICN